MVKKTLFIGLFLLLAGEASADPRDDALSAVQRCSSMNDKAQRLACYDSAAVRVSGALHAPSPPAPVAATAAPPPVAHPQRSSSFVESLFGPDGPKRAPQTTVAQFGSESIANGGRQAYPIPTDADTIDQITARLVNYDLSSGFLIATLDNGQIWRQVSGEPVGRLARPAASYMVTVSRGGSGAYSMKLSGFGRALAVRRLQ